ncbi:MAG: PLDc_N domain-containing protein [Ktedonobacteraceae bacterium]|nr:PLDc_N domain-containing protein [Ktedonobacteraceae bacterium]
MYSAGTSAFGALFACFFFGMMAIIIVGSIFWIWMLVECITREPSEGNDKVVWLLIILFTHTVGALIYFFVRRPQRIQLMGR